MSDGLGEMLIVGIGDPPINLSLGLAENTGKRL
jgi:hypothetical protein